MILLLIYLFLALGVSFLCSIMESVLLSVTHSFAAAYEKTNPKIGSRLRELKTNIDRPLAAILSLNTIAHTVGAAGVGAQALIVFGDAFVAVSSAILTFLILVLSEIIPKTLGAIYWRQLARPTTFLVRGLIIILYPLVVMSQKITRALSSGKKSKTISREEFKAMAEMGFEEGLILEKESLFIKNLLRFRSLKVKDIMTPRPVMFLLPEDMTIEEVFRSDFEIRVSRIPLHEKASEHIRYYVLKNDILLKMAREEWDTQLRELGREILVVPEIAPLLRMFEQLLDRKEHIALVVDEYGGVAGIVTMEDVVETLLGVEIVDETDTTRDMQVLARQKWYERAKSLGLISKEESLESLHSSQEKMKKVKTKSR